ncbi:fumarylacetoacetate hydrolase family protein [Pigmentiphaga litoralis]|uniref:fumarylacetoacetate hydrolase family protein n=1 Tax=Pigmentiphaga litoralis TaxID=516702 RepID=UPI003B439667
MTIIARFNDNRLGVVQGDVIKDVTSVLDRLPAHHYPLPTHDIFIAALPELLGAIEGEADKAEGIPLSSVTFLSPVANPGKLVAAPVNYLKHLEEAQTDPALHHQNQIATIHRAGLFLKATSSLVGSSHGIEVAMPDRRTDHEIELAAIIGKRAKNVSKEEALEYVAAYSLGLDITIRGPEERSLRKSLDTYSVLGPWMVTADEIPDPGNLDFSLEINGEVRQRANTRDLILGVAELIELASRFYTLEPGDIIYTGTPEGVAPILPGDTLHASIEKVGEFTVEVRAA